MKLQAVQCPQCGAALKLVEGARYSTCEHCGVNYVVDWPESQKPQLTAFEALLGQLVSEQDFLVADRRLQYLSGDLAAAQQGLEAVGKEAVAASVAVAAARQQAARARDRWLASAAALTTLLALCLVQVMRTPSGTGRWLWLGVSAVLLVAAIAGWLGWRAARSREELAVRRARERAGEAQARRSAAQRQLKELELERELCEACTRRFRYQAVQLPPGATPVPPAPGRA